MAKSPGQPPSKQGGTPPSGQGGGTPDQADKKASAPTGQGPSGAQDQHNAAASGTSGTTDGTKSDTTSEPPAPQAPPDDGRPADDGSRWECPIKSHWSTRNPSTAAVWRDGSYYCPVCGVKLVKVSD